MKIFTAQINPVVGDIAHNINSLQEALRQAKAASCDLVVFPELVLCGYPPEDLLFHEDFLQACEKALDELVALTEGITVLIGTIRQETFPSHTRLYNTVYVLHDGKVLGYQDKSLLPTYNVFDESRYFTPNTEGQKIWDLPFGKLAVLICEDMWQGERYLKSPLDELKEKELSLVVNVSASPFTRTKALKRQKLAKKVSEDLQAPLLFVNQVGAQDSLIFDGGSFLVKEGLLSWQAPFFEEGVFFVSQKISKSPSDSEALHKALVLGIREYFTKLSLKKAFIGFSGGIDSSVVAALAVEALGKENVVGVAMPSRYSSEGSIKDAEELAKNLGVFCHTISLEAPFCAYLDLLEPFFEGKKADVTEENMQARIRGMILMALANKHQGLVLATGNKSELALGYCTLYGDMCGGLAPLSDLLKEEVYELARYLNHERIVIPQDVLEKPPSAELRPDQKDEDTLPPYAILDKVLKTYVEERKPPKEIAALYDLQEDFVLSIVKSVHRNEFKRRQAALGLCVSEQAFTWGYRYPVVQKWR